RDSLTRVAFPDQRRASPARLGALQRLIAPDMLPLPPPLQKKLVLATAWDPFSNFQHAALKAVLRLSLPVQPYVDELLAHQDEGVGCLVSLLDLLVETVPYDPRVSSFLIRNLRERRWYYREAAAKAAHKLPEINKELEKELIRLATEDDDQSARAAFDT